jgi:hypothetical protein
MRIAIITPLMLRNACFQTSGMKSFLINNLIIGEKSQDKIFPQNSLIVTEVQNQRSFAQNVLDSLNPFLSCVYYRSTTVTNHRQQQFLLSLSKCNCILCFRALMKRYCFIFQLSKGLDIAHREKFLSVNLSE